MRLSVIIPAWNAAETLRSCVESVLAATAGVEAEVIVVDDGSTDGTAVLLREMAARHGEIRPLFQENRGVSAARNRGLDAAGGEWVLFADADDRLENGSLAHGKTACTEAADLIIGRSECSGQERYPWRGLFPAGHVATPAELPAKGYLRGSICGCLFRRSFLIDNDLRFPEGVSLSEDTVFFGSCLARARGVGFWDKLYYRITPRPGSASRQGGPADVERSAAAIAAACRDIPEGAVRSYTLYKLMLMLASRAADNGVSAAEAFRCGALGRILPLPLEGIGAERWKIRLLNASWPLFYRLVALRNRHSPLRLAK